MRRLVALLSVVTAAAFAPACGAPPPSSPPPTSGGPVLAGSSDACAGDPWLAQLLGERPSLVSAMKLDGMKRTRMFGAALASSQAVEMDYLYELQNVRAAAAETYQWSAP